MGRFEKVILFPHVLLDRAQCSTVKDAVFFRFGSIFCLKEAKLTMSIVFFIVLLSTLSSYEKKKFPVGFYQNEHPVEIKVPIFSCTTIKIISTKLCTQGALPSRGCLNLSEFSRNRKDQPTVYEFAIVCIKYYYYYCVQ